MSTIDKGKSANQIPTS